MKICFVSIQGFRIIPVPFFDFSKKNLLTIIFIILYICIYAINEFDRTG